MITVQKEHDFSLLKRRAAEIKAEKGSKVFVDIFEFFVNFKQVFHILLTEIIIVLKI